MKIFPQTISDGGDYRTAPATPGLLNIIIKGNVASSSSKWEEEFDWSKEYIEGWALLKGKTHLTDTFNSTKNLMGTYTNSILHIYSH